MITQGVGETSVVDTATAACNDVGHAHMPEAAGDALDWPGLPILLDCLPKYIPPFIPVLLVSLM